MLNKKGQRSYLWPKLPVEDCPVALKQGLTDCAKSQQTLVRYTNYRAINPECDNSNQDAILPKTEDDYRCINGDTLTVFGMAGVRCRTTAISSINIA